MSGVYKKGGGKSGRICANGSKEGRKIRKWKRKWEKAGRKGRYCMDICTNQAENKQRQEKTEGRFIHFQQMMYDNKEAKNRA